jgi:outer membrane biosynthesis protein TonB
MPLPEPVPVAPPVSVQGYVRAPGRDVAGLTRAEHVEDVETAAAFPAPSPTLAAPAASTTPDGAPVGSASTGDSSKGAAGGTGNWRDTRVFVVLAALLLGMRVAATWLGAAVAVVVVPIVLGLGRLVSFPAHAISGWFARRSPASPASTVSPDFDEYGNPRKKQRFTPFWLAFGGFYLILALIIGGTWATTAMTPAPTDRDVTHLATPTPTIAGGGLIADASPSASPSPRTGKTPKTEPQVVVPTVSTPTQAPLPTPTPTAKPIPVPTPKSTPAPTAKPTTPATPPRTPTPSPKPTPTPSPTPIRPVLAVDKTSLPHGTGTPNTANFTVRFTPLLSCHLLRTYVSGSAPTPTPSPTTYSSFTILGTGSSAPFPVHARTAGKYAFTATCGSLTSNNVTVTWT